HPARVAALALFPDGEASGVAALSDAAAFSVLLSPTAVPGAEVLARLTAFLEPVHTALRSRRATARPLDLL
ncbi:MAG: hypothetical protein NTZ05_00200, partial [Chloroflexi bacterium]|nr:hypothetical protein [Chloroflexota bacterium]